VIRWFEMIAKSKATMPFLWLISFCLKRAIARHLIELKQAANDR